MGFYFTKYKPFVVCENDKKLGFSIISVQNYELLCNSHLSNYLSYENDPLDKCKDTINKTFFDLNLNQNIPHK
ncbi:unnamed protein product, partial [Brachionus calyciflorus]